MQIKKLADIYNIYIYIVIVIIKHDRVERNLFNWLYTYIYTRDVVV